MHINFTVELTTEPIIKPYQPHEIGQHGTTKTEPSNSEDYQQLFGRGIQDVANSHNKYCWRPTWVQHASTASEWYLVDNSTGHTHEREPQEHPQRYKRGQIKPKTRFYPRANSKHVAPVALSPTLCIGFFETDSCS